MEETRYTRKYGGKLNLTLCDPYELCEKRKRIHRDYLAHLFRFYFVGRLIKRGMRILDVGAGTGALAETLYRNMLKPEHYLAVDIKPSHIQKLIDLISKVNFDMSVIKADIRTERFAAAYPEYFDVVCCFEVIEHFESYWDKPEYLTNVLEQMKYAVKPEGVILLSTPNYDAPMLIEERLIRFINNYAPFVIDGKWLLSTVKSVVKNSKFSGQEEQRNTAQMLVEKLHAKSGKSSTVVHQSTKRKSEKITKDGRKEILNIIRKTVKNYVNIAKKPLPKCGIISEENAVDAVLTIREFLKYTTQMGDVVKEGEDIILKSFGQSLQSFVQTVTELYMQSKTISSRENQFLLDCGVPVHKAKNHIYEYTEEELETIFQKHALKVEKKFGTFMSLGRPKQAKQILSECEYEVYSKLYEYYNSSILSVMFAPLHPSESRNILWVLRKR